MNSGVVLNGCRLRCSNGSYAMVCALYTREKCLCTMDSTMLQEEFSLEVLPALVSLCWLVSGASIQRESEVCTFALLPAYSFSQLCWEILLISGAQTVLLVPSRNTPKNTIGNGKSMYTFASLLQCHCSFVWCSTTLYLCCKLDPVRATTCNLFPSSFISACTLSNWAWLTALATARLLKGTKQLFSALSEFSTQDDFVSPWSSHNHFSISSSCYYGCICLALSTCASYSLSCPFSLRSPTTCAIGRFVSHSWYTVLVALCMVMASVFGTPRTECSLVSIKAHCCLDRSHCSNWIMMRWARSINTHDSTLRQGERQAPTKPERETQ